MTQPRWTVRGLLQNGNPGQDPANSRATNRSFLLGLIVGLVLGFWKYATDDTELSWKMRIAAAVGVLVVGTLFAFLLIDYGIKLFRKVQRR